MNSPYEVVTAFEKKVAEYAGAKYGVAVNSCTNALMLSAIYQRETRHAGLSRVEIPKFTYVGVPYAMINAGFKIDFVDTGWHGWYTINPIDVVDSARRFKRDMYIPGTLYCLSFHETKILPVGDGGMILTDDKNAYDALRQMRFDGRTPGKSVFDDEFTLPGYHVHCKPDVACRGIMLMAGVKDYNEDLPETYPDLSQIKYFREDV